MSMPSCFGCRCLTVQLYGMESSTTADDILSDMSLLRLRCSGNNSQAVSANTRQDVSISKHAATAPTEQAGHGSGRRWADDSQGARFILRLPTLPPSTVFSGLFYAKIINFAICPLGKNQASCGMLAVTHLHPTSHPGPNPQRHPLQPLASRTFSANRIPSSKQLPLQWQGSTTTTSRASRP